MILPITLTMAGAAAIINIWLAVRVGQVRTSEKVSIGDGGNDRVIRRMRAHANFTEFTPFVLILVGVIELAVGTSIWLWLVAGVYLLGRIAHPLGMEGQNKGRMVGTMLTMLILLGLGIYAICIPYFALAPVEASPMQLPAG
ncbi:MAG: MAPEG family protein [Parasphingorhabdus sp.]|nr:MAPEG family protein [Parasphingorhabdus sp.]